MYRQSALQMRGGITDNSKMNCHIYCDPLLEPSCKNKNISCDPSLEPSLQDGSNEGLQDMFYREIWEIIPVLLS